MNMKCHCWHHLIKVDLIFKAENENYTKYRQPACVRSLPISTSENIWIKNKTEHNQDTHIVLHIRIVSLDKSHSQS